jgi:hypothetical protein
MKSTLLVLILSVVAQQSLASTLKCASTKESTEQVKVKITTDAFSTDDYSGPASVEVKGLHDSFMNVKTDKAVYMKLENNGGNPLIMVPLEYKGDGQLLIVFADSQGTKASLQHVSVDDEYTVFAELNCK